MSGLITRTLINDDLTTTSLIVADAFGKQHKNVLQAIEKLEVPAEYSRLHFQLTEISRPSPLNGAPIRSKAYRLTRDGFSLLVMGFTGARAMEWKIKFLDAFAAMESALTGKAGATPLTRTSRAGRLVGHREKGGAGNASPSVVGAYQAARFVAAFLWSGVVGGRKVCRFLRAVLQTRFVRPPECKLVSGLDQTVGGQI